MKYKSYPEDIQDNEPYFLFTPYKAVYATGAQIERGQKVVDNSATISGSTNTELKGKVSADKYNSGKKSTIVTQDIKKTIANENSIALHIPRGVQFADSMKYNNVESGILVTALESLRRAMSSGGGLDAFTQQNMTAYLARSGVGGELLSNLRRNNLMKRQEIVSPREFVLFDAPSLRTFNMSFKFLPKSDIESKNVKDIIQTFRRNMYPKFADSLGVVYQFPLAFRIEAVNIGRDSNGIEHMIKFPEIVLKDINVSYNANSMSYFEIDGGKAPVEIDLTLTFSELIPQSQVDIDKGY